MRPGSVLGVRVRRRGRNASLARSARGNEGNLRERESFGRRAQDGGGPISCSNLLQVDQSEVCRAASAGPDAGPPASSRRESSRFRTGDVAGRIRKDALIPQRGGLGGSKREAGCAERWPAQRKEEQNTLRPAALEGVEFGTGHPNILGHVGGLDPGPGRGGGPGEARSQALSGVGCGKGRNDTLRTIHRFCHLYSPVSRMWAQPRGEMCGRNSGTTGRPACLRLATASPSRAVFQ